MAAPMFFNIVSKNEASQFFTSSLLSLQGPGASGARRISGDLRVPGLAGSIGHRSDKKGRT